MWDICKKLFNKYHGFITYMICGAVTTTVNCLVYLPCYNLLHLSATVSNAIAWVFAVMAAFLTNKPFAFGSHDWSAKTVIPELTKFVGCRFGSGLLETGILFVTVDMLLWDGNLWKIITTVLVVILNYAASNLLVFRKKA